VPWMTVTSGASGSGGGVVVLNVASNTGGARSGTATIAGLTFSVTEGAGACGALDVTSQVQVFPGGFTWIPPTPTLYEQNITLRNSSGTVISGPVYLVLIGQPTLNSSLATFPPPPGGLTTCFDPQGDYLVAVAAVSAGEDWLPGQIISGGLTWVIDVGAAAPYTYKVLSGTPSH
jgi:hypothetical protein